MSIGSIIVSSLISFSIAWIGWSKLERRTERTANRSESFSLLTPTISLIGDIKKLAEEQLELSSDKTHKSLKKRQAADIKFLTKYQLLRTKLNILKQRNILIAEHLLVDLRIAYTNGPIDDIKKLHTAFNSADRIDIELYAAFERAYPKPDLRPWLNKWF
ncbi:TPA: hypothetical protein ACGU7E_003795 [Vibrio vulnificus]|nr:hypothetical protein [Vibrio vulnificus]HAS6368366.1 hypothetical protein [Vibrio vulnificus]HDY7612169.1 hypothetical protein [Vibrio vulnificus]